jgi:hypothetical protein
MAYLNATMLEHSTIKSYVRDFKIAEMIAASGRILILYIMLISILYKNKKMMNHLKSSLEEKENTHLIEDISKIRDGFVKLYELSHQIRFLIPFSRLLENAAIDWDDFTEDCVIVSDIEIKNLLTRVNNAL